MCSSSFVFGQGEMNTESGYSVCEGVKQPIHYIYELWI